MNRVRAAEIDLPLTAFKPVRLRMESQYSGFLIPTTRQNIGPILVDGTSERLVIIPLDGERAFKRIAASAGFGFDGLLFADIKLAVNIESRIDPRSDGQLGDLSLADGKVNLLTTDNQGFFGRGDPYPLPFEVEMDAEDPIAFRRWSIFIEDGDREIELWRNHGIAHSTDEDDED